MKSKKETFTSLLDEFRYKYDLSQVFEDFLTMSLCAFSHDPRIGKSHDEALYMETVARYKTNELRHNFPKMLAALILEMEARSPFGNDLLGEYYELNLAKKKGKGQFFTPWPICQLMASCVSEETNEEREKPLRIIDPSCGSGRMLLAGAKYNGTQQEYFGIDIDQTCVKMTAINLFLNGIFHGEIMCADALMPNDFSVSYVLSFLPFGVFRITEKEKSPLWHSYNSSFPTKKEKQEKPEIILPSESGDVYKPGASQLQLF